MQSVGSILCPCCAGALRYSHVCQPYMLSNKLKLLGNSLVAITWWCSSRASIKTHIFLPSSLRLISLSHNIFLTGYHRCQPIVLCHGNFEVTSVWLQRCVFALCPPSCGLWNWSGFSPVRPTRVAFLSLFNETVVEVLWPDCNSRWGWPSDQLK